MSSKIKWEDANFAWDDNSYTWDEIALVVEAVSGPNVTNDYLRHLEGMRFIVAILLRRITSHNQGGTDARTRIVKPNKRIIK